MADGGSGGSVGDGNDGGGVRVGGGWFVMRACQLQLGGVARVVVDDQTDTTRRGPTFRPVFISTPLTSTGRLLLQPFPPERVVCARSPRRADMLPATGAMRTMAVSRTDGRPLPPFRPPPTPTEAPIAAPAGVPAGATAGRVLAAAANAAGVFDDGSIGGPVVLPPDGTTSEWRMWYNGRSTEDDEDQVPLPTGAIGLAVSLDGMAWRRVAGDARGGAVFDRAADAPGAWDHLHIGAGSVVADSDGGERLTLYYFGGSAEAVPVAAGVWAPVALTVRGLRMRVGAAVSNDGGRSWTRAGGGGPVLDVGVCDGDWDALYVGWPHVRAPEREGGGGGAAVAHLTYHTYHVPSRSYRVGAATSTDGGVSWTKAPGPVLAPGPPGAFDDGGHGTRCVVRDPAEGGSYLMFVEGVRAGTTAGHSIGVLTSADGVTWTRTSDAAVLAPAEGGGGGRSLAAEMATDAAANGGGTFGGCDDGGGATAPAWDSVSVGCPSAVFDADAGHWKVYYVGFGPTPAGRMASGIGLAVSDGADWSTLRRVDAGAA